MKHEPGGSDAAAGFQRHVPGLHDPAPADDDASLRKVMVVRHGPFYTDPRVVKECLALCDAGYDVTVTCRGASRPWITHPRLHVRETKGEVSENPLRLAAQSVSFALRVAASSFVSTPPDVVVVHSIPSWLVFAVAPLRLRNRRIRILLDHHEPEAEMLAEAGAPRPATRLYRRIERAAVRSCDGVVDVSPEMAERSRALGARRQVVVDNAPLVFDAEAPPEKTWDLAVFGSLIRRYDLPVVDEALGLAGRRVDVIQIGRGTAALQRNRSRGRFESLPYSPPPELQRHLRSARFGFVGLAPSEFTDFVSPNRLWELVSMEIPAIVAETALTRRLLGDDAVFYRGGDAKSLCDAIERAQIMPLPDAEALARGARARLADRLWERQRTTFVDFCRGEPEAAGAPEPRRRIGVVSNALEGPPDEGTRKLAREIAAALGGDGIAVSVKASSPAALRKLLVGRPVSALRGRTSVVVYVPTQSLTAATYLRVQALKRTTGSKVVLIAPQARAPLPLERRWARFAAPDVLLSPSLEVVKRAAGDGIDARFLAPGVDVSTFHPVTPEEKAALRKRLGLPDGKVVLHVGHASPHRNLGWLIAARRRLGVEVVVVVGSSQGVDAGTIALLEDAGITVLKEFLPDIAEVYAASDCYAFPVLDETGAIGTPLSVLEAMACNLPVVSTPFGGLTALFEPRDGLYFEDEASAWIDALEHALGTPESDVRTRALVSPQSWESVATRVVDVADELAGTHRSRRT